ncbi:MAG: hypothetical protein K8S18_17585, partial [Desulfobacula sp.]|nr:hypothetical protein [Desulfobacula sp.]
MKKIELKHYIKKVIPKFIMNYLLKKKRRKSVNFEFANFILTSAIEYSKKINGDIGSFDRRLKNLIINSENDCNSIVQDILTAFMPNYEKNLYQYYKNQEYLIFYRFLAYPFMNSLSSYFLPYEKGLLRFKSY